MMFAIPVEELTIIAVLLGSYAVTQLLKALKLNADPLKVNALISVGIGVGLGLLHEGEPLDRVLIAAAAAVLSAVSAASIHRVGDGARALIDGKRAEIAERSVMTRRLAQLAARHSYGGGGKIEANESSG